ncbi:STAS domain-containing protein [Kitasatospora sp. NPDC058965]|uniref:STAS domain-containing protein n=1 Tax=Kitasatospora sp. NPDC058965 TaxID=3346682 RepID=UPI0036CCF2BD
MDTTELLADAVVDTTGPGTVLRLRGELDLCSAIRLAPALLAAARTDRPGLVVDLSRVTFCDSSGARLVTCLLGRRPDGELPHLRGATGQPARVLRLLGVLDPSGPDLPAPPPGS